MNVLGDECPGDECRTIGDGDDEDGDYIEIDGNDKDLEKVKILGNEENAPIEVCFIKRVFLEHRS